MEKETSNLILYLVVPLYFITVRPGRPVQGKSLMKDKKKDRRKSAPVLDSAPALLNRLRNLATEV